MKIYRLGGLALVAGLVLGACGSSGDDPASPTRKPNPTVAPEVADSVKSAESELGTILVNAEGRTLYGFTKDTSGNSTCFDVCAQTWPPITVNGNVTTTGLDAKLFTTFIRSDGATQLKAGKWPLYLFSGDNAAGDVNGQGSGGVWFAVAPDGSLIKQAGSPAPTPAPPATSAVGRGSTELGTVLVDGKSMTLYGFTNDVNGTSTCSGACANAWPPLLVGSSSLPSGLDANVFSVITRTDGTFQLKAGKWPLYRFAGDSAAGEISGQGSGGVWFAAAPDGSLIKN
jgi:predicted lipoprotein with Yx(FWY)xxD motif